MENEETVLHFHILKQNGQKKYLRQVSDFKEEKLFELAVVGRSNEQRKTQQ